MLNRSAASHQLKTINRYLSHYAKELSPSSLKIISKDLHTILYYFAENMVATYSEENVEAINQQLWQARAAQLTSYLDGLKNSTSVSKENYQAILTTLNDYIYSADYAIPGKLQKKSVWEISLVSQTAAFNAFQTEFSNYCNENQTKQSFAGFTQAMLSTVFQTLQLGFGYVKKHPIQAATFMFAAKVMVADALKFSEDKSLVAYYPFNTNALDATGNKNDGTVYGAKLTTDRFGEANSAYYFDSTSYIFGKANTFPRKDRTIAMWFKPAAYPMKEGVDRGGSLFGHCGESNDASANFGVGVNDGVLCGNNPNYGAYSNDIAQSVLLCDVNLYGTPMIWNHIAFTSNVDSGMAIYINGKLQCDKLDYSMSARGFITDFTIGALVLDNAPSKRTCDPFFKGSIDDVMIFDRGLTANEVQKMFDEQSVQPDPTPLTPALSPLVPEAQHWINISSARDVAMGGVIGFGTGLIAGIAGSCLFFKKCCKKKDVAPTKRFPGLPVDLTDKDKGTDILVVNPSNVPATQPSNSTNTNAQSSQATTTQSRGSDSTESNSSESAPLLRHERNQPRSFMSSNA